MNPLISLIVPVYNVEQYLDDCVRSIIHQSYTNFELILVDDGSPDRCPQICDSWAAKDCRIKVIHKINGGLSDARNIGIDAATGEYVWFVDSDDWIANDALTIIACSIDMYPNANAIAAQIVEIVDDIVKFHGFYQDWPEESVIFTNVEYVRNMTSILPSVRYVVKRDIYEKYGLRFIVGVLHEDMPFCHMLMNYTKQIAVIPKVIYYYRIRSGSITTSSNIGSCYSLVESHKELMCFMNEHVMEVDRKWFMGLTYDLFYEMFLRIYPFLKKKEYIEFMKLYGGYIRREFKKMIQYQNGKRKFLGLVFSISPKIYSKLIYNRRLSRE